MSVIVITGSSSGFGMEAALEFARHGDTVIATMRDTGKGRELLARAAAENLTVELRALDVAKSDTFKSFVTDIVADCGSIDVLVNNAGLHRAGALEDVSEDAFRSVMETNCIGPLMLTRAVLSTMREQGNGLVIMVSSLSGIAGLPGDLPYAASKFALEGATEALRHEVDRWGIRVALVEAGMYKTGIMSHNLPASSALPENYPPGSPYEALIAWQLGALRDRMPDAFEPADVAKLFVRIAESKESRLRWPADAVAEKVLATMFGQDDAERDEFLRSVAGCDWWSQGKPGPGE